MNTTTYIFMEVVKELCFTIIISKYPPFLAYQIRKSDILTWDRDSYLTHLILPMGRIKKEKCHVKSVYRFYRTSRTWLPSKMSLSRLRRHNDISTLCRTVTYSGIKTNAMQDFPGRRILRLRLPKMCLGLAKKSCESDGTRKICVGMKK